MNNKRGVSVATGRDAVYLVGLLRLAVVLRICAWRRCACERPNSRTAYWGNMGMTDSSGSRIREFVWVRVVAGRAVVVRFGGFSRLGALVIGARCVVKSFAVREYLRMYVLQFMRQGWGRPDHFRCRSCRFGGLRLSTAPLPCLPGAAESVGRPS